MAKVSFLALGNWGTALAYHLASHGVEVLGWSHDREIIKGITEMRRNPRYLSHLILPDTFKVTASLEEALALPIVVLSFPSAVLTDLGPKIQLTSTQIAVSLIKGFEDKKLLTPLQFLDQLSPDSFKKVVLSGPSFAADIAKGNPAGIVAASTDIEAAKTVAEIFTVGMLRVYYSSDPLGVELGGSTKNIIALAVGVADGLGLGDSARAGLITRGLTEMTRLGVAMGADARTFAGLSGLGDLVMTASSELSRNRRVGLALGRGEKLNEAVRSIGSVVEGVKTAVLVDTLAQRFKVEMPITSAVVKLISGEVSAADMARALLSRPTRQE